MAIRLLPKKLMGQTIRGIRTRLGVSQESFAESLGIPGGAAEVRRWEQGKAQPDYGTIAKIAAMGVVDVLVFHEPTASVVEHVSPGEAAELRSILMRMETLMREAREIVDRAARRLPVEVEPAEVSLIAEVDVKPARVRPASGSPRRKAAADSPSTSSRSGGSRSGGSRSSGSGGSRSSGTGGTSSSGSGGSRSSGSRSSGSRSSSGDGSSSGGGTGGGRSRKRASGSGSSGSGSASSASGSGSSASGTGGNSGSSEAGAGS